MMGLKLGKLTNKQTHYILYTGVISKTAIAKPRILDLVKLYPKNQTGEASLKKIQSIILAS